ncbi:hypothetical protein AQJ11_26965 [Streptomyces corchorusii]|uniref:Uncharacterized protein n=1 Tax=Streptomyces corchorusii TaxID=1903 RepID=A0A117QDE3_STRCK|nr:hypothetical protein AQJ11_26965 [Streptomyces corchorusii]
MVSASRWASRANSMQRRMTEPPARGVTTRGTPSSGIPKARVRPCRRAQAINSVMCSTERTARSTCDQTTASYAWGRRSQGESAGLSNGEVVRAETPRSEASATRWKPRWSAQRWTAERWRPGDVVTLVTQLRRRAASARGRPVRR